MRRQFHRIVIASLQVAGLLLFSAWVPLAHLHREGAIHSHHDAPHVDRAAHHGITFHAHLDGHRHESGAEGSGDAGGEDGGGEESLSLAHGRLDSPRVERSSRPLFVLAAAVELALPSIRYQARPGDRLQVYRPPPLVFRKPARAPPSSC